MRGAGRRRLAAAIRRALAVGAGRRVTAALALSAALNLTSTFTPDAVGNVIAMIDPLGHTTTQTFDADRRPLLSIAPDPGTGVRTATRTVYDANGRQIEMDKGTTNSAGANFAAQEVTTVAYDPSSNKLQTMVFNGTTSSTSNPPLAVTQTSYDALNRPLCTAVRENQAAFLSLPASACTQSALGAYGPDHITQFTYDLAGQKTLEQRGIGSSTVISYARYAYSLDGNVATIEDANNNLTTNTYDGYNRLVRVNYPYTAVGQGGSNPSNLEAYAYDNNGNRVGLTKRDGSYLSFTYDALNRLAKKVVISSTNLANVAYAYDLAGRPTSALFANQSGTPGVTWAYDAAGRRTAEATDGRSMTFGYDAASNETGVTWPDGGSVTYAYDTAGRLTPVGNSAASVGIQYDALSRINAVTRGSGASTSVGYDFADRMTSLAHAFTPSSGDVGYTFAFTPAGQVASASSTTTAYD